MHEKIEPGFMAFTRDGAEGIAAVREVMSDALVLYVENVGEFVVKASAVTGVHSGKVILDARRLDARFLQAIGHRHDAEDPKLEG